MKPFQILRKSATAEMSVLCQEIADQNALCIKLKSLPKILTKKFIKGHVNQNSKSDTATTISHLIMKGTKMKLNCRNIFGL